MEREIGEKEAKGVDRSWPLPTRRLCIGSMPACRASSITLLASHMTAIVARAGGRKKKEGRDEGADKWAPLEVIGREIGVRVK
jgi:hypothetical protein